MIQGQQEFQGFWSSLMYQNLQWSHHIHWSSKSKDIECSESELLNQLIWQIHR